MVVSEVQEATATPPHAESCATDVTPVPSLAFTTLSSSPLSVGLTTTGSVTGSHIVPPASSPGTSRDPILAEPSPVGPPRPTRSLWDEFTPIMPSRTLPPLASIPPENRAAAATVVGTVPDRETLLTWLREVDGQRLALDIARANLMCELSVLESESLRETSMELDAAQQRCRLNRGPATTLPDPGWSRFADGWRPGGHLLFPCIAPSAQPGQNLHVPPHPRRFGALGYPSLWSGSLLWTIIVALKFLCDSWTYNKLDYITAAIWHIDLFFKV